VLDCYGPYMPLRVLEEVRGWKRLEKEHAAILRELVPTLEPELHRNLQEWEAVFEGTERCAELWLASRSRELDGSYPPLSDSQLDALLQAARAQSEGFIQHLQYMLERSTAVQVSAVAPVMLRYAQRSSRQQSTILNALSIHNSLDDMPPPTEGESRHDMAAQQFGTDLRAQGPAVPIGGHTVPPLPYAYNALEPHIDEATMRIHHDKHHQSYVDGLNRAEKELLEARRTGNFDLVKHWERELAFNGAGHYLHTVFWPAMSPQGGGEPRGALADAIRRDFGSFAAFKQQFSQAAEKVEGGGWALLVWSPRSGRLEILQAEKHQNLSQWESIPLLPLDVWEHAYYLKHQNKRADYIRDWWNVVNWPYVAERYAAASRLRWKPY
jgi:superoxide dismutase, Fe-Mn family